MCKRVRRESFRCGSKLKSVGLLHKGQWRAGLALEEVLYPNAEVIFALLPLAKFLQNYLSPSSDSLLSVYSLFFLPLFVKSFALG